MHPDGWLRRRSTRFHGIKDSALNPRDCRGCVEGREGQREGDRASARSERGQWSRRRKGQAEFWVSGFAPLHEVRRKAALCDECGTVGQRTPWPPRRPTPPRCIHPDAIRTTLRFSLPSLSLSFLLSSAPLSLSLPVIRFLLTDRIALRYATTTTDRVERCARLAIVFTISRWPRIVHKGGGGGGKVLHRW